VSEKRKIFLYTKRDIYTDAILGVLALFGIASFHYPWVYWLQPRVIAQAACCWAFGIVITRLIWKFDSDEDLQ
jgi:hypothetical protein